MNLSFEQVTPEMLDALVETINKKVAESVKAGSLPKGWKHFNDVEVKSNTWAEFLHRRTHEVGHLLDGEGGCKEAHKVLMMMVITGFELALSLLEAKDLDKLLN